MTGLADCNNFFVSCERTVNPSLCGKAVVVGSNNDGCVVARSNEAKALGVKMGQPIFQLRDMLNSGVLTAVSGHHLLYRQISLAIHDIFRRYVPKTIDYSVDEAFLDMQGVPLSDFMAIGTAICDECWNRERIPVTIGFSHTKTLAKIITEVSKKKGVRVGVLTDSDDIKAHLKRLPISELWGIGRRLTKRLYQAGIYTIADFHGKDKIWVRSQLGVNGERSWLELHGVDCIELSHIERHVQDSISETRTFPDDVGDPDYLRARLAIYAADCAKKLRGMAASCSQVTVFLRTNRFHPERGIHCPTASTALPSPTDRTVEIVAAAAALFERIFDPHTLYKRAGVILTEIKPTVSVQASLFDNDTSNGHDSRKKLSPALSKVLDSLNGNVGKPVVKLASQIVKGHPGHNDGYSSSFQSPRHNKRGF